MSTSFHAIRIFFDVEQKRILFHNGDQDLFRAVYSPYMHLIEVLYFGDSKSNEPTRVYTVSAPRKLRDNIEAWLHDPNISIDIEGTTGEEYDKFKKQLFEQMRYKKENNKSVQN
jgi:hypothetical protein